MLCVDTAVTGGQSILNPWAIIGGVAKTIVKKGDYIFPDGILPGDVMILTKPIGTQIAVNLREWVCSHNSHEEQYSLRYPYPQSSCPAICCIGPHVNSHLACTPIGGRMAKAVR